MDSKAALANLMKSGPVRALAPLVQEAWTWFGIAHITPVFRWVSREDEALASVDSLSKRVRIRMHEDSVLGFQTALNCPVLVTDHNKLAEVVAVIVVRRVGCALLVPKWEGKSWWPNSMRCDCARCREHLSVVGGSLCWRCSNGMRVSGAEAGGGVLARGLVRGEHPGEHHYNIYATEYVQWASMMGFSAEEPSTVASFMRYCVTERPRKLAGSTVANLIPAAINYHFLYVLGPGALTETIWVKKARKAVEKLAQPPSGGRWPLTLDMLREIAMGTEHLHDLADVFRLPQRERGGEVKGSGRDGD